MPVYLLAADLLNTALSAILTFSDHVLYPQYLKRRAFSEQPRSATRVARA